MGVSENRGPEYSNLNSSKVPRIFGNSHMKPKDAPKTLKPETLTEASRACGPLPPASFPDASRARSPGRFGTLNPKP